MIFILTQALFSCQGVLIEGFHWNIAVEHPLNKGIMKSSQNLYNSQTECLQSLS